MLDCNANYYGLNAWGLELWELVGMLSADQRSQFTEQLVLIRKHPEQIILNTKHWMSQKLPERMKPHKAEKWIEKENTFTIHHSNWNSIETVYWKWISIITFTHFCATIFRLSSHRAQENLRLHFTSISIRRSYSNQHDTYSAICFNSAKHYNWNIIGIIKIVFLIASTASSLTWESHSVQVKTQTKIGSSFYTVFASCSHSKQ